MLETKDSAVLAVFFDTEIRAATTSQSLNVLRPSFKSTEFYKPVDQVKALQSGVLVSGETFSTTAAVVAGGISPLHFVGFFVNPFDWIDTWDSQGLCRLPKD